MSLVGGLTMKQHTLKLLALGLTLGLSVQVTQAAVISTNQTTINSSSLISEKQSPIEKALSQQKRDHKLISNQDELKVFASLKSTASQNFLAEQHQRFSRFVQAIFQPHSS